MRYHEILYRRPPFLLDGIHLANQGGMQQYDSKRDKFLKSYLDKKKQDNPRSSVRMKTESVGQLLHSSVNSLNQSIQPNQKLGIRRPQASQPHQYKSSPDYMQQQNETPKRKRNTEVSLPKLETGVTNQQSNLKQPITKEQLLLFLDQIRLAVDNVQQIVCSNDNQYQMIQQSQPIRSSKKFKISQEQQTDSSYIQQLLKSRNSYVNKINKKTQTPGKDLRSSSQQDRQIHKLKTEQNEESDVTEKKGSRFPNISQSAQKARVQKVLPQYKTNRVQSQILQNQEQIYYNEETNKLVSSNETQQFSSNSNVTSEDVRKRTTSKKDSTQKKNQKKISLEEQQMIETNKNVIKIIDKNQQTQQNSIKQLSSQRYSSEEFEETEQIILSKSSNQQTPIEKQPTQQVVMEERSNLTPTPVQNKRPIHVRNTNPSEKLSKEDSVVITPKKEITQQPENSSQQQSKQQQQTNINDEDYEYSNEFLSEHTKDQVQEEQKIEQKDSKQSIKQSQRSSKIVLEINPQPEYYPEQVIHNQDDLTQQEEDKLYQAQKKSDQNQQQKQISKDEENDESKKKLLQSIQVRTPNNTQEKEVSEQNDQVKEIVIEETAHKSEIQQVNESQPTSQTQVNKNENNNDCQKSITQQQQEQEPEHKTLCQSSLTVQSFYVSKSQIPYRGDENKKEQKDCKQLKILETEQNKSIQVSQQGNQSKAQTIQNQQSQRTNNEEKNVTPKVEQVIDNGFQISKNEDLGKSEIIQNQSQHNTVQQTDIEKQQEIIQTQQEQNEKVQTQVQQVQIDLQQPTSQSNIQDQQQAQLSCKSQQVFHVQQNEKQGLNKSQLVGKNMTWDPNFLKLLDQKKQDRIESKSKHNSVQQSDIQIQQEIMTNKNDKLKSQDIQDVLSNDHSQQISNDEQPAQPPSYKSQQLFYVQQNEKLEINKSQIIGNIIPQDPNFLKFLDQKKQEIQKNQIINPQQLQNSNFSEKKQQESQKQKKSKQNSLHQSQQQDKTSLNKSYQKNSTNELELQQQPQTEEPAKITVRNNSQIQEVVQNKDQIEQSIAVSLNQAEINEEAENLKQK